MEYILESSWPDRKPEAEEWPEKKKKTYYALSEGQAQRPRRTTLLPYEGKT